MIFIQMLVVIIAILYYNLWAVGLILCLLELAAYILTFRWAVKTEVKVVPK